MLAGHMTVSAGLLVFLALSQRHQACAGRLETPDQVDAADVLDRRVLAILVRHGAAGNEHEKRFRLAFDGRNFLTFVKNGFLFAAERAAVQFALDHVRKFFLYTRKGLLVGRIGFELPIMHLRTCKYAAGGTEGLQEQLNAIERLFPGRPAADGLLAAGLCFFSLNLLPADRNQPPDNSPRRGCGDIGEGDAAGVLVYDVLPVLGRRPGAKQEEEQLVGSGERASERFGLEEVDNLFPPCLERLAVRRIGLALPVVRGQADLAALAARVTLPVLAYIPRNFCSRSGGYSGCDVVMVPMICRLG